MEAGKFNAQGSFGIPDNIRKQLEETKKSTAVGPTPAQPAQPPLHSQPEADKAADTPSDLAKKDLLDLKKGWEERLGITITEADVRSYIFKGKLIKEGIDIIPGYMKGVFQSQSPKEIANVDKDMATFREEVKFTPDGLTNQRAVKVLSYGWLKAAEVEGDVVKPYRALGDTPASRYETIMEMAGLTVQEAIDSWDGFNLLIKIALREKRLLKKS